uniref:Uncharacterized protein n=1 Tax=Setaria italica TaxID=4555 RepID=K3ZAF4_SETIT
MAAVFVYPSLSVTWTAGTSASWEALGLHQEERMTPPSWWSSYVYGCLYCKALKSNKFLKLDVNRMEFSAVSLLPNHENRQVLVVEAGEGKIGIPGRIFGQEIPESWRYSISAFSTLEIKTSKIERVCSTCGGGCGHILPYFVLPPFMSPRRI